MVNPIVKALIDQKTQQLQQMLDTLAQQIRAFNTPDALESVAKIRREIENIRRQMLN